MGAGVMDMIHKTTGGIEVMDRKDRRAALRRMMVEQLGLHLPEHVPGRYIVVVDDDGHELDREYLPGDDDDEEQNAQLHFVGRN